MSVYVCKQEVDGKLFKTLNNSQRDLELTIAVTYSILLDMKQVVLIS